MLLPRSFLGPPRGRLTARRVVNEAGFEADPSLHCWPRQVGVTMSPEEADRLGLKPFGDGGAENETSPQLESTLKLGVPRLRRRPKLYTHGPCQSPYAAQFVVCLDVPPKKCHEISGPARATGMRSSPRSASWPWKVWRRCGAMASWALESDT